MDAGVGIDKARDLTDLKSEGRLFEGSLHLAGAEEAKVTAIGSRAALAVLLSDALEVLGAVDLRGEVLDVGNGLLLGPRDGLVAVRVHGVSRLSVLLQNVADADLGHLFTGDKSI